MSQESILSLGGFRYLKWSLILAIGSIVAYVIDEPRTVPNGGTWLGYTLGILGALLIVWLILFGMRKRAYRSNLGTVRGWLSAHIWLGLSLLVVATLHTGFQFGINIHTLAYALMVVVILSGIWGVTVYMRNPSLMSGLVGGKSLQQHGDLLKELDAESRNLAKGLGDEVQRLVEASAHGRIVNGLFGRFGGPGAALRRWPCWPCTTWACRATRRSATSTRCRSGVRRNCNVCGVSCASKPGPMSG